MNIKVNLQDGTPAQFKTEIIDGSIIVTVVEEEKQEKNLFPKWEELGTVNGAFIDEDSRILKVSNDVVSASENSNMFTTLDLAKAALATARVSQTYKRYRELVGDMYAPIGRKYGLLRMTFVNHSDAEKFYEANKEDLELIRHVKDNVQL